MMSQADNELLTQVGPETPMGELIRRFWVPALLAEEIPDPDGAPRRVRLLGEDLVAFRDSKGRVGLLEERCPHRQASLALGVNEECGLRCLYHGWKFGVDGECQETPTEPESSTMHTRIRAKAYPVVEAGGAIWTYMGPPEAKPPFPHFEWVEMAANQSIPFKVLADCNYAQLAEGTIDSAHAGVLHRESAWDAPAKYAHERDLRPKLEVEYTPYGLRYAATRQFDEDQAHARVTQIALPFFTLIPPDGFGVRKNRRMANAFVPRDDVTTWHFQWFFDQTQPVDREYRIEEGGHWVDADYRKELNVGNWYKQDREMMKVENLSGIRGILTQDHAVSETQGPILDRTKEHLGTSDAAVVAWRRLMIRSARELAERQTSPEVLTSGLDWSRIKAATVLFPKAKSWREVVPLGTEAELAPPEAV